MTYKNYINPIKEGIEILKEPKKIKRQNLVFIMKRYDHNFISASNC
jgi:hypothetical protein